MLLRSDSALDKNKAIVQFLDYALRDGAADAGKPGLCSRPGFRREAERGVLGSNAACEPVR